MATPTVVNVATTAEGQSAEADKAAFGSAATWWYDWVDGHRVGAAALVGLIATCLLYTSPSPRDRQKSRMPSSA